jgi:hypothetical protein
MNPIKLARQGDDALLQLPVEARLGLARVMADWLNIYAGMGPSTLRREHFDLVVEVRRLLLTPDERPPCPTVDGHAAWPDKAEEICVC